MTDTVKKALTWLVIAFLVFFAVTHPAEAADKVNEAGRWVGDFFSGLETFFNKLAS